MEIYLIVVIKTRLTETFWLANNSQLLSDANRESILYFLAFGVNNGLYSIQIWENEKWKKSAFLYLLRMLQMHKVTANVTEYNYFLLPNKQ